MKKQFSFPHRSISSAYQLSLLMLLGMAFLFTYFSDALSVFELATGVVLYGFMKVNYRRKKPWLDDRWTGALLMPLLVYCLYNVMILKQNPMTQLVLFIYILNAIWNGGRAKLEDYWNRHSFLFLLVMLTSNYDLTWTSFLMFIVFITISIPIMGLGFLYRQEKMSVSLLSQEHKLRSLVPIIKGTPLILIVGLLIFFIFPRSPFSLFNISQNQSKRMLGYTDKMALTGEGEILVDTTPMVRVFSSVPNWVAQFPHSRYLRGSTLDRFDGKEWFSSGQALKEFKGFTRFQIKQNDRSAMSLLETTLLLDSSFKKEIFYPSGDLIYLDVLGRWFTLEKDDDFNLYRTRQNYIRMKYNTGVALEMREEKLKAQQLERYLQFPEDWKGSPAFREWTNSALKVTETLSPSQLVAQLKQYFLENFSGSYENEFEGEDKLISFLIDEKSGHCEYFSSAAVLALRLRHIPARIVGGYAGGDWNSITNALTFTNEHAHAWVEYYDQGSWHLFDPTVPSAKAVPDSELSNLWNQYIDAISFWVESYMIEYSFSNQKQIVESVRTWLLTQDKIAETMKLPFSTKDVDPFFMFLGTSVILGGGLSYLLWKRYQKQRHQYFERPHVYELVLQRFEEVYGTIEPSQSPLKVFYAVQSKLSPQECVVAKEILHDYYAYRYGKRPFPQQELTQRWKDASPR
ncbi:DUF3488 and transglutaminase-like domain-containing protein [Deltaproteobacteria bacterium TL4]